MRVINKLKIGKKKRKTNSHAQIIGFSCVLIVKGIEI